MCRLVPRLPPCFYLACGKKFSTSGEIKARGKPGNEATLHILHMRICMVTGYGYRVGCYRLSCMTFTSRLSPSKKRLASSPDVYTNRYPTSLVDYGRPGAGGGAVNLSTGTSLIYTLPPIRVYGSAVNPRR